MNININIAAQMLGTADYRTAEPLDRPPTAEECALAVEIGYEIATRYGIDLAAHVAAHHKKLAEWEQER